MDVKIERMKFIIKERNRLKFLRKRYIYLKKYLKLFKLLIVIDIFFK
jgi:hypothetical protein